MSPSSDFKSLKIGSYLRHIRVPGKDASGGSWDTYCPLEGCEFPDFAEIADLVKDVRRLLVSLQPSLLYAKEIPFPSYPQTIMPPSLQCRGGSNFDHRSKGSGGRG